MSQMLYLARHAECIFNARNKIQGWCDSPLTERGNRQAVAAGDYLRSNGIEFSKAFCSTSPRTAETLRLMMGRTVEHVSVPDLREISFGLLEGESGSLLTVPQPFGDFLVQFGGESERELQKRVCTALDSAMHETDGNVLAVSHGTAVLTFMRTWSVLDGTKLPSSLPGNCCVLTYRYDNGRFALENTFEPSVS